MEKIRSLPPPKIFLQKYLAEQLAKNNNNNSEPLKVVSENNQLTTYLPIDFNSESFLTGLDFNSNNSESFLMSIGCEVPFYSEKNSHNFKEESQKRRYVTGTGNFLLLYCPICRVERYRGKADNGMDCLECCTKWQYKCAFCKKMFDSNSAAKRHIRKFHKSELEDTENIGEPDHDLSLTDKSIADKLKFISAMCKNCNTKAPAYKILPEMCLTCVTKLSFSCEKCSKQFRTYSGALQHGSINCIGVNAYKCVDCNCAFYYKDTLERHVREKHMTAQYIL